MITCLCAFHMSRFTLQTLQYQGKKCDTLYVIFSLQLEVAKKSYHMACKEEMLASNREANSRVETSMTADQQKKLHEKLDKCKQDSQKVRTSGATALKSPCGIISMQKVILQILTGFRMWTVIIINIIMLLKLPSCNTCSTVNV